MRIAHHTLEIQIHPGREGYLWVVFDEEGEQLRAGSARDEKRAMAQARRTAGLLAGASPWLAPFTRRAADAA